MSESDNDLARALDPILDSYNPKARHDPVNEQQEQKFLAKFERIRVEVIKPTMKKIGMYLEKKGHSYQIQDRADIYDNNSTIKMEIYPKTSVGTPIQEHEFPTIAFIAEPDIESIGIEVRDGMPGHPGLTRGHTTSLDSLTVEYVKSQIITVIEMNFIKRAHKIT